MRALTTPAMTNTCVDYISRFTRPLSKKDRDRASSVGLFKIGFWIRDCKAGMAKAKQG